MKRWKQFVQLIGSLKDVWKCELLRMENTKWVNWKFCKKYSWKVQPYITDNAKWYIGPGGPICYETEV